ncbi:MAG: hypothetical protein JNM26_16450 [Ideonella sp.]|nr:hypothetical protein [Ideonella sp.]
MIDTLTPFWPILALVGVFALGFGIAWWLRAEDARQMRAEIARRAESYDEMAAEALTNARKMDELRLGWQAVRAAVDQHTV